MSTPPHILAQILTVVLDSPERAAELIELRGRDSELEDTITLGRAYHMARLGEIEAVGTRRNRLRYVRKLAQPADDRPKPPIVFRSNSTAVSRLNLGAYKQPLRQIFTNEDGIVTGEGEICGWVYSLCACRELDGSIEEKAA